MALAQDNAKYASPGVITWTLTDTDTIGQAVNRSLAPDKTVQVNGSFATGTVTIQGTNDDPKQVQPAVWDTLHNPLGVALTFVAAGRIDAVMENPLFIRAILTGAAGAASVRVTLVSKGFNS